MKSTNRPYSYTNVYDNCHKIAPKKKIAEYLAQLAKKGDLTEKAFGKVLVYHYN